ncbi:unnamed protein product [Caenorhabditis sp. 36 PRJEB53466]|nr:unnamed protein product [Caenorhabditis sp. 36 PRJEB53466]
MIRFIFPAAMTLLALTMFGSPLELIPGVPVPVPVAESWYEGSKPSGNVVVDDEDDGNDGLIFRMIPRNEIPAHVPISRCSLIELYESIDRVCENGFLTEEQAYSWCRKKYSDAKMKRIACPSE